jgi:hypothetical protein
MQGFAISAVAWAISLAGASWWAYGLGKDHELASQYRENVAAEKASQAATNAAATAISKIEVKHVTQRQLLEREVQTREVFRDCRSGDDARRLLNASPGVAASAASTPGRGELSTASTAR